MEYAESGYEDRIIAVQCRWLIDAQQYTQMTVDHHAEWTDTLNQITKVLSDSVVEMPTLKQVQEMEGKLSHTQCADQGNSGWSKCVLL